MNIFCFFFSPSSSQTLNLIAAAELADCDKWVALLAVPANAWHQMPNDTVATCASHTSHHFWFISALVGAVLLLMQMQVQWFVTYMPLTPATTEHLLGQMLVKIVSVMLFF